MSSSTHGALSAVEQRALGGSCGPLTAPPPATVVVGDGRG
jgi:hypothetical protein